MEHQISIHRDDLMFVDVVSIDIRCITIEIQSINTDIWQHF